MEKEPKPKATDDPQHLSNDDDPVFACCFFYCCFGWLFTCFDDCE